ncbi:hypothetical protein HK100_003409 [Physocladia obscura]|uniref:Ricin B lectin domain-containing protein n=1 Tax=Physocladia obscura TaxID=109957 RepID=A0AAD5T7I7_9FUNG|nr:hypothetical protein HK100_003409 [Physocladia obscura]
MHVATVLALTLAGRQATAATVISIDPSYQHPSFEGWGTSLAWLANVIGGYPDVIRTEVASLIFGSDGLNLNIARYNIGGGNAPSVINYLRPGGAVPGWWNVPMALGVLTPADKSWWNASNLEHWNFDADQNQRWFVENIKASVNVWEVFSNSPPWFQTVSGYVSGGFVATDEQIRNDTLADFADYLVTVAEHLEQAHGIKVGSIEPVNEPNTNYWQTTLTNNIPTGGRQEGAHVGPAMQSAAALAVASRLLSSTSSAIVASPDETNPTTFLTDWVGYSVAGQAAVSKMNVHTYGTSNRMQVRDLSKGWATALWMSEVEGSWATSYSDIQSALGIGQHIIDDIRELEPYAWVLWQPVEDYYNMIAEGNLQWGSMHIPFNCTATDTLQTCPIHFNTKFYGIRHFTLFIVRDDNFIKSSDTSTIAAIKTDGRIAIVHINNNNSTQSFNFDLSRFGSISNNASVVAVTSTTGSFVQYSNSAAITSTHFAVSVPSYSITTFLISGVTGVNQSLTHIIDGSVYSIQGVQSGKSIAPSSDGTTLDIFTNDSTTTTQRWIIGKVNSSDYSSRGKYTIKNVSTGKWLAGSSTSATSGTTVFQSSDAGDAAAWVFSTSGDGTYTIINVAVKVVLDVSGQSTAYGAPVGLWQPNGGTNQFWTLSLVS